MIVDERWQRVRALFAQSLEQTDDTRDVWLRQKCSDDADVLAEIQRLLAHRSRPAKIFSDDAQALLTQLLPDEATVDALLDTDVGPYRLKRLLGEGGMGRVYLAERVDDQFKHQVALKLIRSEFATPELRQRFLRERNVLARLAHPNIAQLHDGGVIADGTPYFTLEFIEGTPITRWCDAHNSDVRARVNLLISVSEAVRHAHRNLIVHRDLKPSNILVNEGGEPKLLDFGIAKPLADAVAGETLTHADARPMTREYAAPEQLLGDPVTTATDIYSLGVLLYLLLSGHLPYRRAELGDTSWIKSILEDAPEAMEDAVERDDDAERIAAARSTNVQSLQRNLRGDLERIVQRALAKSPESRYPTVDAFADDLRAYLAGRAISGGTRTYRMRKFVRRHWLPLTVGAALFLVVLGSAIALAWEAGQVERQARTTAAVKNFILDLFQKANPNLAQGKVATVRDAVDLGVQRLDSIPASEPELKAELQVTLGTIYYQLGLFKQAQEMHAQAVAALRVHSPDPLLTITAERFDAIEIASLGDYPNAEIMAEDALARVHALRRPPVVDLVRTLDTVNFIEVRLQNTARMKQLSDEAIAAVANTDASSDMQSMAYAMKGDYARKTNDCATAIDYYKRAWALKTDVQTRSSFALNLGTCLQNFGRYDEADSYILQARETAARSFGEGGTRTLRLGQMLGINQVYGGHVRKSAEQFAHLLEVAEKQTPRQEEVIAEICLNYGESLMAMEQFDQARALIERTLVFIRGYPTAQPSLVSETFSSLGFIGASTGKLDDAEKMLNEGLAYAAAHKIDDTSLTRARLGYVRLLKGDIDGALSTGKQALDEALKTNGEHSLDTADVHYFLGRALAAAGHAAEAQAEYRASIASHTALLPPDGMHFWSANSRLALGEMLVQNPQSRDEGTRLIDQGVSLREETLGHDNPHTIEARQLQAKVHSIP